MSQDASSSRAKAALVLCLLFSNIALFQVGLIFGHVTTEENSPEMRDEMTDLPPMVVSSLLLCNYFSLYNGTWYHWSTNVTPVDGDDLFVCAIGVSFTWRWNVTSLNTTHNREWYPWQNFNLTLDRVVIYGSIEERYIDEYGTRRADRHSVFVDSLESETTSLSLLTDTSVCVVFWGRGDIHSLLNAFAFAIIVEIDGARIPVSPEVEE